MENMAIFHIQLSHSDTGQKNPADEYYGFKELKGMLKIKNIFCCKIILIEINSSFKDEFQAIKLAKMIQK